MLVAGDRIDIWVVEKALGSGGMGSVYRCHNHTANRILAAVKVLEGSLRTNQDAKARFIREAEIMYQLDHPNIVKVRNIRTETDPPYLEMEFVEGESFEDKMERGPIEFDEALDLFEQMASAIAYLHSMDIRHRDIKPANLLLNKQGLIKLVDFGLAVETNITRITQQGMAFGTVSYAPPEWITPDKLDPERWDIYAAGVVFYEMITGKLAFPVSGQGSARQQAMQVIVGKQNRAPLDPGDGYHGDLRMLIRAMTHKDPRQRPQSAREVHEQAKKLTRKKRTSFSPDEQGDNVVIGTPPLEDLNGSVSTWTTDVGAPDRATVPPVNEELSGKETVPAHPRVGAHSLPTIPPISWEKSPRRFGAVPLFFGLIGTILVVAAVLASVALVVQFQIHPKVRTVDVVVAGLSETMPVDLMVDGIAPESRDGFVFHFGSMSAGTATLTWIIGARCPVQQCPGPRCPQWCGAATKSIEVEQGEGTQNITVTLSPAEKRDVYLVTPQVAPTWERSFRLRGKDAPEAKVLDDGVVVFEGVQPDKYQLVANFGDCDAVAYSCLQSDNCPEGCVSHVDKEFVVPWGSGELRIELKEIPALEATEVEAQPKEPNVPGPGKTTPTPPPPVKKSHLVTNAEYAGWLKSNSDWQRESAISKGYASNQYLKGWTEGSPPTPGNFAVVNVSYYAALAFCKSRGGLADALAEPLEWAEAPGIPSIEWRAQDGKLAWRDSTGIVSKAGNYKQAMVSTGFRCAR
ncbi:MAG: serine/threonine protein kinase [Proteobacteria bacterium]|nr:serine/threonine protein kinase [Pseudomonadota bacterium]